MAPYLAVIATMFHQIASALELIESRQLFTTSPHDVHDDYCMETLPVLHRCLLLRQPDRLSLRHFYIPSWERY